jgi:hypothetical protein
MSECNFDSSKNTKIIHILVEGENPLKYTNSSKIEYLPIKINELSDTMLDDCRTKNILIFVSSRKENNTISINDFINKVVQNSNTKKYKNVTIINETDDTTKVLFNNNNFKKIVNVFPINEYIYTDLKLFDNFQFDKTYYIDSTIKLENPQTSKWTKTGGSANSFSNEIAFQVKEILHISDILENQWWYKWYFSIPPIFSSFT